MLKLILAILLTGLSLSGFTQVNMVIKEGGFLFMEGKDSICFFQRTPKDKNGQYARCNYIHPLYGMDGARLTEDFPADHLHHRGIFWAWHQILINDKPVSDGWELKNFEQKITDLEFRQQKGVGILKTEVDWKSPFWKSGSEAYLKEETTITMYPRKNNYRRIDFTIQLKPLTDRFSMGGSDDDKGYSGFSVRLKLPEDVIFSGEQGPIEPTVNAVEAGNTLKIAGSYLKNGGNGGIVIRSNPSNPSPSGHWIIRKKASMQNAAYPGRQPVAIPFDEPLVLNYSLLIYQGDLTAKQIKKAIR